MANSRKRSYETDELLGLEEAAKVMGLTVADIKSYARRGLLRLVTYKARVSLVSLSDLGAIAGLISHKFNFPQIAGVAMRAWVSATRAERRIARLEELLGVTNDALELTEEAIVSFHRECVDLLTDYTEDMPAPTVLAWAYKLSNVTEEYLDAVKLFTGTEEPWAPFTDAAQKLYDSAPRDSFRHRKDLESAYGYVSACRRHLRQVAYFYIRNVKGAHVAARAFPETSISERDDKIIRLIFMMRGKQTGT